MLYKPHLELRCLCWEPFALLTYSIDPGGKESRVSNCGPVRSLAAGRRSKTHIWLSLQSDQNERRGEAVEVLAQHYLPFSHHEARLGAFFSL